MNAGASISVIHWKGKLVLSQGTLTRGCLIELNKLVLEGPAARGELPEDEQPWLRGRQLAWLGNPRGSARSPSLKR